MNYYTIFLHTHSGLRWLILLLLTLVVIKSLIGLFANSQYAGIDRILGTSTVMTFRLQFVVGLILYLFLSPYTAQAFADFGAAMKDSELRYWAVEHIFVMLISVGLVEFGTIKAKKANSDKSKFKFQLIFLGISLAAILFTIPWSRV